ncbi:hypothetical protein SGLAM104S_03621 [Streptomyces glaucescens]
MAPSPPSAVPVLLRPCGHQRPVSSSLWADDQHQETALCTGGSALVSSPAQARMERRFIQGSAAPEEFVV